MTTVRVWASTAPSADEHTGAVRRGAARQPARSPPRTTAPSSSSTSSTGRALHAPHDPVRAWRCCATASASSAARWTGPPASPSSSRPPRRGARRRHADEISWSSAPSAVRVESRDAERALTGSDDRSPTRRRRDPLPRGDQRGRSYGTSAAPLSILHVTTGPRVDQNAWAHTRSADATAPTKIPSENEMEARSTTTIDDGITPRREAEVFDSPCASSR